MNARKKDVRKKARAREAWPGGPPRATLTLRQLEADDQEADRVAKYDTLLEELDRADALALHLMDRLAAIDKEDRTELFALSLVARGISDRLQLVGSGARTLFEAYIGKGGAK
jgi:hypothetical protein